MLFKKQKEVDVIEGAVFKLLKEKFNLTLIIISHDLNSLFNLADKIIILYKNLTHIDFVHKF